MWLCIFNMSPPFLFSYLQIYYKVIKEIEPGEELLVYMKEGAYSLGNMPPSMEGKIIIVR